MLTNDLTVFRRTETFLLYATAVTFEERCSERLKTQIRNLHRERSNIYKKIIFLESQQQAFKVGTQH